MSGSLSGSLQQEPERELDIKMTGYPANRNRISGTSIIETCCKNPVCSLLKYLNRLGSYKAKLTVMFLSLVC